MRRLSRLLFFGAAVGLAVWVLLKLSPDRPTMLQAPATRAAEPERPSTEAAPWTQEERAIWRDAMDRRLR